VAITLEQLKQHLTAGEVNYFVAPDKPMLLMGFGGYFGTYQLVMHIELEGRFLLVRTLGYASCPDDHPHRDAMLKVLAELNSLMRTTKFSWDPNEKEVVVSLELWLEDATLTSQVVLSAFLPGLDLAHQRITETLQSGADPGMPEAPTTSGAAAPAPQPPTPVSI
jgi:hypothetical protein